MQGSGTSHEPLDGCETVVRDYLAQGQCTLAIGILIQHYQDAIVSYCRCHLLDQELAREVAQEIFVTACAGLSRFRGHSSLKTWLYGIAVKKCLEVGRTRTRRAALVHTYQDTIGARVHCDPPSLPEDLVSQECLRRRVWQALRRLRVYDRELLVLRYLEELTYDEIASILHVSRRTVERHLPRAKAKFCQAYERDHTHLVGGADGPAAPPPPAWLVSRAVSPAPRVLGMSTEAPRHLDQRAECERAEPLEEPWPKPSPWPTPRVLCSGKRL